MRPYATCRRSPGQKPDRAQGAQVDRRLQAARGHADRRRRHAARRAHVGVRRPPDQRRPPRIRDFRGVKTKLDGRGNYTLGLAEQTVFPEIDFDRVEYQRRGWTSPSSPVHEERRPGLLRSSRRWGCRSRRVTTRSERGREPRSRSPETTTRDRAQMAKTSLITKSQAASPSSRPGLVHPLFALCGRAARRLPQVRDLPHLPPRAGAARRDPRDAQGLLVGALLQS